MARRRLLGDEQWAALFALPAGERDLVRHCTLTPEDLVLVTAKRSARKRKPTPTCRGFGVIGDIACTYDAAGRLEDGRGLIRGA